MAADGGLASDAVGGAALGAVLLAGRASLGTAIAAYLPDLRCVSIWWWWLWCCWSCRRAVGLSLGLRRERDTEPPCRAERATAEPFWPSLVLRARARRRRNGACTAQLGAIREGSVHTLHRSHACPVRFESASFLFTEPEKSLLLLRRWCGLVDWMPWCVCEMPWPCCSIRWILLMLARLASSSDMRFVPDAMIDASAVSSELRLTREQPGC